MEERRSRLRELVRERCERCVFVAGELASNFRDDVATKTVDAGDGFAARRLRRRARRGCQREQIARVDQAFEQMHPRLRVRGEREEALRERDERGGEIAAVHRGDVSRAQRRQRHCVVPVEEVALMALEPFERRERAVEPTNERLGRQVPEIVRGQRRQERHADVGRGSAPGQSRLGGFLVIVGRQPRVGRRDECLVIPPRLPGRPAQQPALAIGERPLARPHRHAQPVRDTGRDRPQSHERQCRGQGLRVSDRDEQRHDRGDDGAGDHVVDESEQRAAADDAGRPRRCGGGCFPFEETSPRNRQPDQRQDDGVRRVPGVIREKRDAEDDLRERDRRVRPEVAPEHREGLRLARPDEHLRNQGQQLRRHHGQHGRGPEPVSAR